MLQTQSPVGGLDPALKTILAQTQEMSQYQAVTSQIQWLATQTTNVAHDEWKKLAQQLKLLGSYDVIHIIVTFLHDHDSWPNAVVFLAKERVFWMEHFNTIVEHPEKLNSRARYELQFAIWEAAKHTGREAEGRALIARLNPQATHYCACCGISLPIQRDNEWKAHLSRYQV